MRDLANSLYTFLAVVLLAVMLVGSPLASFGCQTVLPAQFNAPCETNLGQTAVQTNFLQPASPIAAFLVLFTLICWLKLPQHPPEELFLLPPSPPPRSFV